jgi:hypothetical protein
LFNSYGRTEVADDRNRHPLIKHVDRVTPDEDGRVLVGHVNVGERMMRSNVLTLLTAR